MSASQAADAHDAGQSHLILDVSPELRQRLELSAARHAMPMEQYILDVLEQASLDNAPTGIPLTPGAVAHINELRERIMRGKVFEDSSVDILHELRAERLAQL